jgi:predicted esterase
MNQFSQKVLASFLFLLLSQALVAQQKPLVLPSPVTTNRAIDQIAENNKMDADATLKLLKNWSDYPVIEKPGKDYLYYYVDSLYGKIPLRIFIPGSYNNARKSTCIVLLHGAVGISKFTDIDSLDKFDDDILFSTLKKQDYVIIRPVADTSKGFNWAVSKGDNYRNLTFLTLNNILVSIKKILNIDDNKIFAIGHSDGSDGAIGLGVYCPDPFAGLVAYNSMLYNIFAQDFYIRNIINIPLYLVHSDLDDLRPIQQTRIIVNALSHIGNNIVYKEYIGYRHYDKHLEKDLPLVPGFITGVSRNPFKKQIFWEADQAGVYSSCDWIKINEIKTSAENAKWHTPFNFKCYDKNTKQFMDSTKFQYYYHLNKSAAVNATYNKNRFNIETSRVGELELLISPAMVNLEYPVVVVINGKQLFAGMVKADKNFIVEGFKKNFDRDAIWVNSIKLKVGQ